MIQNQPDTLVIVPVYNDSKFLKRCLAGFFSPDNLSFEGIVVDDNSTDGSADISRGKRATILSMPPRRCPAATRKFGVKIAHSGVLLIIAIFSWMKPQDRSPRVSKGGFRRRTISALDRLLHRCTVVNIRGNLSTFVFSQKINVMVIEDLNHFKIRIMMLARVALNFLKFIFS